MCVISLLEPATRATAVTCVTESVAGVTGVTGVAGVTGFRGGYVLLFTLSNKVCTRYTCKYTLR